MADYHLSRAKEGAWVTLLLIPLMLMLFMAVNRHYNSSARLTFELEEGHCEGIVTRALALAAFPRTEGRGLRTESQIPPISDLSPQSSTFVEPLTSRVPETSASPNHRS